MQFIIAGIATPGRPAYNSKIVEIAALVLDGNLVEVEAWSSPVGTEPAGTPTAGQQAPEAVHSPGNAGAAFRSLLASHPEARVLTFQAESIRGALRQPPWSVPESRWGESILAAATDEMEEADALEVQGGLLRYPSVEEALAYFGIDPAAGTLSAVRAAGRMYAEILRRRRSRPSDDDFLREARYVLGEGY